MRVIDSHTGGEPTRVIFDGGPDLGSGSIADRARCLAREHTSFSHGILREPRGQPAMVGALRVQPVDPRCATGVIFFDAAAVLNMCGHGTIGLAATLAYVGEVEAGTFLIETPAGVVEVLMHDNNTVTVTNVQSRVFRQNVTIDLHKRGFVKGTIAYGGNWFFIIDPSPIPVIPENIETLTQAGMSIRKQLNATQYGTQVDHIIFQGSPIGAGNFSRNFVLCPDDTYDRSPCGTGSSAFLACLANEGRLLPEQEITQESIIGSLYRLSYRPGPEKSIIPMITGGAFVMADSTFVFSNDDPFRHGIPA